MMIAEEEALKRRLLNSIETCHKELKTLCTELQLPPFEVLTDRYVVVSFVSAWKSTKLFCLTISCSPSEGRGRMHYFAVGEGQPHTSGGHEEAQAAEDGRPQSTSSQGP